jgi:peptidoglycan/xylan/chitin deacetylase (PgdA/CDA1 family)
MTGAVPILMYHQVAPRPPREFSRYALTPRRFAAQMTCLSLMGYRAVGLDAFLSGRDALPRRSVVITFDDGIEGCLEHVMPVLSARRFTAIFYLVAGLVGQRSRWTRAELGIELPLMDWAAVRSLEVAGFEIGSHTMTHPRLPTLAPDACREELAASRRLLEDRLGHEVVHLAYPFGAFDDAVRSMAADAGYRSACSTRPGLARPDDDPLALSRVNVYGHESLLDFACRVRTGRCARELLARRRDRSPVRPPATPTPSAPAG